MNTTLNFNSQYLITGVDKIDDLLFFTDNYNQPRVINVNTNYPDPSYIGGLPGPVTPYIDGGGSPAGFAESLLVIKKPPNNSPTYELLNLNASENFLEEKFICFAYRYRYADDMYSATSQFTDPAFIPDAFNFDVTTVLNEGMVNLYDTAVVTFNTGGPLVVGIDLLFKEASNPVIRIVEKLNKSELGYPDNSDKTYTFSNNKIYSLLDDNEILRLYDNVPLKAKAQTVMGKRLMYGNYIEGYDVSDVDLRYIVDYITDDIGVNNLTTSLLSGTYDDHGTPRVIANSVLVIELSSVVGVLKTGSKLEFEFNFIFDSSTSTGTAGPISETVNTLVTFTYVLQQDFNSVQDLLADQDFKDKIGSSVTIQPINDSCNGITLTDNFNCKIPTSKVDSSYIVYNKVSSGIYNSVITPVIYMYSAVPSSSFSSTQIALQLFATTYRKDGTVSETTEYYKILTSTARFQEISETSSLHSNRDYEVGIMYMDDYNRATTVLVSPNNIIHLPCSTSDTKNTLRVTIPKEQHPPSWASRYKLAIKQNTELYETIYSISYFRDVASSNFYFLLDGENAQKVKEGDVLTVKKDSLGPLDTCVTVTILEKKAQEKDFIKDSLNSIVPAGVYMMFNSANLGIDMTRVTYNSPGRLTLHDRFIMTYKFGGGGINFDANNNLYADQTIAYKSRIEIRVNINTYYDWFSGDHAAYTLRGSYTASQTYSDFMAWWHGDNIGDTLGYDSNGAAAWFNPANATSTTDVQTGYASGAGGGPHFRLFRAPAGYQVPGGIYLLIGAYNLTADIVCEITFINPGATIAFETRPQDAAPDIFYESSVSHAIINKTVPNPNGYHSGNVQDQTVSLPAIINTEFQNCFAFGNGVESYKIRDSITLNTFGLGNRVSAVLKGEDYREVHRFADITYSGTYGYNVNNLNEFNLGLLNFKVLEPSFGVIQKLFARATDILTLQEDKISYVLAGKNLLSDAAAGGVITSVPEVLGTQIARIEEYGIGNNPESFAEYGYDKYFTDSRRGVVIQLKGSAYSNEQLNVISDMGMSSWFRDLFLVDPNTQKLGGYDPYMKEYVLSSNSTLLPYIEKSVKAGISQKFLIEGATSKSYTVELGEYVGTCTLTYSVKNAADISGEWKLSATYDSTAYPNPPGYQVVTGDGQGSFTFDKDKVLPSTATVNIVGVTPSASDKINIEINLSLPDADTLNIIQVCISDNNDKTQTIHNEYKWTSGTFVSPLHSNFVSLAEGTTSPLISEYETITGFQGGGVIPIDTAPVELISHKYQSDDFAFDVSLNNFGYLRSATLYPNTPAGVLNILNDGAFVSVPGAGGSGVFSGSFTMPGGSTNDNLYLMYDYRKPVLITLCYSNTSADDSCCVCGTTGPYYLDAPTLAAATAVYTSAALDTKATDGWYSTGGFVRKQTSGVLEINSLCSACNLACGTTLSMDTLAGVYTVEVELGAPTGAVVIDIDFESYPEGVKVVYDGVTYNDIYSPNFGFINSPGTHPVYAGITAFDCSISGTTFFLRDYQFNGTTFTDAQTNQNITVDPTSVFLKASGLGTCKMIIPKTAASPSTATMTIISPCEKSDIEITAACPAALSSFLTTRVAPQATNIAGLCTLSVDQPRYHVLVNGTAGNPAVGDIMFQDANGVTPALAGFYAVVAYITGPTASAVIEVDANGIIINSIVACIP